MSRQQSKYVKVNPNDPSGASQCDRCGRWWNLDELTWQYNWGGNRLYNLRILVCPLCYDKPSEFLRTIILPPDPLPLLNARTPDFDYEEQTVILMQFAGPQEPPWGAGPELIMCDQTGETALVIQYLTQSQPDAALPG
jgi:hypothetical protein